MAYLSTRPFLVLAFALGAAASFTGACSGEEEKGPGPKLASASSSSGGGEGGTTTSSSTGGGQGGQGGVGGQGGTGGVEVGCGNGIKDGAETDVDCGGAVPPGAGGAGGAAGSGGAGGAGEPPPMCPPCGTDKICGVPTDCASLNCVTGVCAAATCMDGIKNDQESDIDCGGAICTPCADGQACGAGSDCASKSCDGTLCLAPTCADTITNGAETDTDCGGQSCGKCDNGEACLFGSDCLSGVCENLVCAVPTCSDGVKNGSETDTDCGGMCPANCTPGNKCAGNGDCTTNSCVNGICKCPKDMAIVAVVGGGNYCIDATEVTRGQYEAFWPSQQLAIPRCAWNVDRTPSANWPPPAGTEQLPVTNIDWCDAAAYCKWASDASGERHVCGKIGGGSNAYDDFADPSKSQWMNACSAGGNNDFPYGDVYDALLCYGADHPSSGLQPVRQLNAPNNVIPFCEGGAPGLYQMSGNVAEWDDSCELDPNDPTGASDLCRVRGGSFSSLEPALRCDIADFRLRNERVGNDEVGFRCCL